MGDVTPINGHNHNPSNHPSEPVAQPSAIPLDATTLGSMWAPAPFAWNVLSGKIGEQPIIFLLIETPTGRQCYGLDDETASAMAKRLLAASSGLVLP